jgi:hypothetical protein
MPSATQQPAPGRRPHTRAARSFVAPVAALLGAVLLVSCGGLGGGSRRLFEFVPASSAVAAGLDWRVVRENPSLQRLVKANEVERLFGELGIEGTDVDEFVIFGDGQEASSASAGIILRGGFDVENVIEKLKSGGWSEQAQDDATLYVSPAGDEYLAALDDLLVAGTRAGVLGVLGSGDERNLVAHPTYEKLAAHLDASGAPVFVIVAAPQRVQDMTDASLKISSATLGFAGLGAIGSIIEQLGAVRGVGCSIDEEGNAFPVEMVAVMRDEEAASLVSGTLNLAQSFASRLPQNKTPTAGSEGLESFQKMSITRDVEVLSIKLVMTESQLRVR